MTGAARRIGRGIALALAADGWAVAVHHHTAGAEAEALVAEIRAAGGEAVALGADLGEVAEAEALIERAAGALGELGLLVNNASRFSLDRLESFTAETWDAHMAVNARAPALLARDFARHLGARGEGLIINLLDQKLWNQNPDFLSYTLSKVALRGLTEVLALALYPRLRVCAIAPGLTLPSDVQSQAQFNRIHGATPLGRGSTVAAIAEAVRFLIASPGLTGETLMVDGGQHLSQSPRDVMFNG